MGQNFGKVLSPSDLLNLGGPAGGSAPGKVLRPKMMNPTWLVETEMLSSVEQQYFIEQYRGKSSEKC